MPHVLKWRYGRPGKGLVDKDGDIHTWAVFGPNHDPDHNVYQDKNGAKGHFLFRITHDGCVYNDQGYLNQFREKSDADVLKHIVDADPQLRPTPTDQWMFNDNSGLALTSSTEEGSPYSDELKTWLQSLEPSEEEELSPHHHSPADFIPTTEVVGALKKRPLPPNPAKYITTKEQHQRRVRGRKIRQQKKGMAVDPEWWEESIRHDPYLYHATSDDTLHDVLSEGLIPWDADIDDPDGEYHRSQWDGALRPRPGHVYLGKADFVHNIAQSHGTKNRVVKVKKRDLDPTLVNADEDAFWSAYPSHEEDHMNFLRPYHSPHLDRVVPADRSGDISRKYTELGPTGTLDWMDDEGIPHTHSYGDWANLHNLTHPNQTRHSLDHFGAVAYNGEIPSHALEEDEAFAAKECPECGYPSSHIDEDYAGNLYGECYHCGWDSENACANCQHMPSDHEHKPLLCEHCGDNPGDFAVGDPIHFGNEPSMITKLTPDQLWISTHGEEPWQVPHELQGMISDDTPDPYKHEWLDPQSPHYPLAKWPEGYVKTVPLPGQEKLWYQDPAGEWTPQTWKDQHAWDLTHQAQ